MTSVHYVNNTFEDNSYLVQWHSETASQKKTEEKGRSTKVVDCKFGNSIAQFKIDGSPTANELLISNTHFENSPVTVKVYESLTLNVIVEKCSFKGSGDYPSSSQVEFTALRSNTMIKATVLNCTFRDSVAGSVYSDGFITNIIKTTFLNNSLTDNRYFTNTRAAALTITSSTYVYLVNCTFLDNKALPTFYDSICYIVVADSSEIFLSISNLIVVSSSIVPGAQSSILQLKSDGFMYGFSKILDSTVFCGLPNYNIYDNIEGINPLFVRLSCQECDGTKYNAQYKSKVVWDAFGDVKVRNSECYDCPYEASCINGIKSKGNYWGYANDSGYVAFVQCPPSYCCPTLKKCDSYNSCANNRQGRLCGECKSNHSISLFGGSRNRCVETSTCQEGWWLWLLYAFVIIFALLTVLYYKDVFEGMTSKLCCCFSSHKEEIQEQSTNPEDRTVTSHLLIDSRDEIPQNQRTSVKSSGIIKIAFFFYQSASIIRINAPAKLEYHMPFIVDILTSFFNVKIDIGSADLINICPLQTQNVALIEFVRLSLILGMIVLTIVLLFVLNMYRRCQKIRHQTSPFTVRLKITYTQLLVIGYASIAMFSIQSIDCIYIEGDWFIFNQAHLKCLQSWQVVIILLIVSWVVPFPVAMYFGNKLLRSGKITPNKFLMTLMFPPLLPIVLIRSNRIGYYAWTDQQQKERMGILNLLSEPFREREAKDDEVEKIIWEPVLITRRLILVITITFVRYPIMKLYPTGVLLILFTIHDYLVQPFVEPFLNLVQLISMLLLGTLVLCNMFWAFSMNIDILESPQYYIFGNVLLIVELSILLAPVFVMVFCLIWKLGKVFYKECLRKLD